ncbi:hypothetical protein BDQ17DRAFT_499758 [Cyathus striatus]|nr:hypothetical protein BDQ17DRAFT_499758 [Cyathus striatus]
MNPDMHYYGNVFPMNTMNTDLSSQFPFTFHTSVDGGSFSSSSSISSVSPPLSNKERRLSVTSSSSSSASSFSPPESSPSPPATGYASDASQSQAPVEQQPQPQPTVQEIQLLFKQEPICTSEPPMSPASEQAAELAQRVRQSAGVMLAVPMNSGQISAHMLHQPVSASPQLSKLPIPRLQRFGSASAKSSSSAPSSAASTPPPSTPLSTSAPASPPKLIINANVPSVPASDPSTSTTPTTTAAPGSRPKTSHTTIERRYRTNLNARIQSLRMAVPALRVLEDREGGNGKKIKKNVRGGVPIKGSPEAEDEVDVIDERGFVDGVKVARKCSKANVLGKAVEYIRVLKRREMRLKAEQAGLKMLISGLVGGPALLREWEREWRERFGGEEKDEVEGELEVDGDDEDSDDEDDEEAGRKRKRNKTAAAAVKKEDIVKPVKKPAPSPVVSGEPGAVPEKRKRGRPRKVVPPPVPASTVPLETLAAPQPKVEPVSPQAAPQEDAQMYPPSGEAWTQQGQQPQQYLLAVFALFSFFNSPFTSNPSSSSVAHHHSGKVLSAMQPPLALAPEIISQFTPPSPSSVAGSWGWKEWAQMFHLVVSVLVLASFAASWIGASARRKVSIKKTVSVGVVRTQAGKEVDWAREAEECALAGNDDDTTLYARYQIYRALSINRVPAGQRATLAIVMQNTSGLLGSFARAKARSIWESAKSSLELAQRKAGSLPRPKLAEKLVLEELDVESAATRLQTQPEKTEEGNTYGPIEILASQLVHERVKKHLGALFVDTVLGNEEERDAEQKHTNEEDLRRTIDTAKEIGGTINDLGRLLERAWRTPSAVSVSDVPEGDEDTKALFTALILYPRVFMLDATPRPESALLSPPPSPKSKTEGGVVMDLRKALGSRVFEDEALEDARDRVVDLVVDNERRCRSWSP